MYFRTANDVLELAQFISQQAGRGMNDMQAIAQYRKQHPERILPLPLFDPATYPDPVDPVFATHLRELECVFDGAAYGQVCDMQGSRIVHGYLHVLAGVRSPVRVECAMCLEVITSVTATWKPTDTGGRHCFHKRAAQIVAIPSCCRQLYELSFMSAISAKSAVHRWCRPPKYSRQQHWLC